MSRAGAWAARRAGEVQKERTPGDLSLRPRYSKSKGKG